MLKVFIRNSYIYIKYILILVKDLKKYYITTQETHLVFLDFVVIYF